MSGLASNERPDAPLRTDTFRLSRPDIVGGELPGDQYPVRLSGLVQHGFGRGGKDLGCPTANLPEESLAQIPSTATTGIYFGYAQVASSKCTTDAALSDGDCKVWPMVMSLGWNPYYKNEKLTAEVHILHEYQHDFYGYPMKVIILGYIRPELDYTSREALIDDIEIDKKVGIKSLERPGYEKYRSDPFFDLTEG